MKNKVDVNNVVREYLDKNNVVTVIHNCVYIFHDDFDKLSKMFPNNIKLNEVYNVRYIASYRTKILGVIDGETNLISVIQKSIDLNLEDGEFRRTISWNPTKQISNDEVYEIVEYFKIYIAPMLIEPEKPIDFYNMYHDDEEQNITYNQHNFSAKISWNNLERREHTNESFKMFRYFMDNYALELTGFQQFEE